MRWEDFKPYTGRVVGITLGLISGIIYLIFGFWKAVIFTLIVSIGYYLGKKIDKQEKLLHPAVTGWFVATGGRIKARWRKYKADRARSKWR